DRGMSLRLGIAQRLPLISELLDLFRSLRFLAMILQMLLLARGQMSLIHTSILDRGINRGLTIRLILGLGSINRGMNLNRGLCRIDLRIRWCLVLSGQERQRLDRRMSLRLRIAQRLQLISELLYLFRSMPSLAITLQRLPMARCQLRIIPTSI